MDISFYLKRPNSAQETTLFARISYGKEQIKYYVPLKIHPDYWNVKTQKARESKKFPEYPEFNTRLSIIKSTISTCFSNYLNNNGNEIPQPEIIKELLDKELKPKKKPKPKETVKTFFDFFQELIDKTKNGGRVQPITGKPYSKATIQIYNNTLNRLKVFQESRRRIIDFNTIDIDFYTDFTQYLSKRLKMRNETIGLSTNTIGKDIKIIKVVMNEAQERGLHKNTQYKSAKFSTISEETDSIYLNENELQEIAQLDLSENKTLDNVRDQFLIGCYTGLRFSDFSILTPEQIKDGFIDIKTQTKTGQPIVIPMHPIVLKIVEKYKGSLPRSLSNQRTNGYLKEIGEKVPSLKTIVSKTITKGGLRATKNYEKWQLLCTHTARRSFATNEYLAFTPTITIMAITGHRTEKAFLRYIKLTPDEHAKILKSMWGNRNNLKAV